MQVISCNFAAHYKHSQSTKSCVKAHRTGIIPLNCLQKKHTSSSFHRAQTNLWDPSESSFLPAAPGASTSCKVRVAKVSLALLKQTSPPYQRGFSIDNGIINPGHRDYGVNGEAPQVCLPKLSSSQTLQSQRSRLGSFGFYKRDYKYHNRLVTAETPLSRTAQTYSFPTWGIL